MKRSARVATAAAAALVCGLTAGPAAAWTDPPRGRGTPASPVKQKPAAQPRPRKQEAPAVPVKHREPVRKLPWSRSGTSVVAHVKTRSVRIYAKPRAKQPINVLRRVDKRGTPRVFLVRKKHGKWAQVYLPTRPNGSTGWVRRRALRLYVDHYRLVVRLRQHKLELWRRRHRLGRYKIVVGKHATPTPRGLYYVVELLKPPDPHGAYGPYSFGISAHSPVLKTFNGGDGRVGLHGTNEPSLLGSSVSHGCIRVANRNIRRLARILPLGTPVWIRT
jgi:lipoprotein-anchoring transpeptidase ErfK/SrfK